VSSENAFSVQIGVVLLGVTVVPRESLFGVRDIQTTICGSLEGSEETVSSGGGLATDIQQGTEGTLVIVHLFNVVRLLIVFGRHDLTVYLGVSLVEFIESNLLEETTGTEKTGAVGGGVVLQADGESVSVKLGGLSLTKDAITIDQSVSNLADNLGVGETDNKPVLGRLVLVLVLATQSLSSTVIGLTLASASELDLVPRKVGLGFSLLNERLINGTGAERNLR